MSARLEPRYAYLDHVPDSLVGPVVRHVHGELRPRATSICTLRVALLDVRLADHDRLDWPEPNVRGPLLDALGASGIAELCEANPELTDDVLRYILDAVHEAHRLYERGLVAFTQIVRQEQYPGADLHGGGKTDWRALFGEETWRSIRAQAMELAAQMAREMLRTRTDREVRNRADLLRELGDSLRELTAALGLPPGTQRGFLRKIASADLLRLRAILSEVDELTELIARLGRGQDTDPTDAPTVLERLGALIRREVVEHVPGHEEGPIDLRGVERSGEVARMLPSEAAMLAHPALRKLWMARWAERSLMTYHAHGVLTQRIQTRTTFEEGLDHEAKRMNRGPVVVILDTSGSMAGAPDRVAKAIVMQIAGTAFMQERPCYVYNFSGNGDIVEQELGFDADGITTMLGFLTLSFGGGTQPDEPLRRAMKRLESQPWRLADLVIVSDGEFTVGSHIAHQWHALKGRMDARAVGLRVGFGDGFDELPCDEVHDIRQLG